SDTVIGAGTILDSTTARLAILAGADFIVSPIIKKEIIDVCNRYGILSIIGALTPTEILKAYENGADIVKVFPAQQLGVDYLKQISAPLGHIPIIPTGGINLDNVKSFYETSNIAVGVGGSLVNPSKITDKEDYTYITE